MAQRLYAEDQPVAFVRDGELILADFRERDPEVVHTVEHAEEVEAAVHRLLGLGARTARLAGTTLDTTLVSGAFERMTTEFDAMVSAGTRLIADTAEKLLDENGTFPVALGNFKDQLAGLIEATFDPDSKLSALAKLDAVMSSSAESLFTSLRHQLDPDDEDGPLATYRREILREIREQSAGTQRVLHELSERIAVRAATAQVEELGSGKGFAFEETVHRALIRIVSPFGDVPDRLSALAGATGAKVGDEVVTLNPEDTRGVEVRYVVEAKDRRIPSLKAVLDELGRAMTNREATAGIAVFSGQDRAPVSVPFQPFGDKAIVVLDKNDQDDRALGLACAWARWVVRRSLVEGADGIDPERVGAAIEDARRALARVSAVRRAHAAARNRIDQAAGQVEDLVGDIDRALAAVSEQIRA